MVHKKHRPLLLLLAYREYLENNICSVGLDSYSIDADVVKALQVR